MTFIYTLFGTPLGYVMWACYLVTKNIGLAIVIFTVIIRAAMFPLGLKQQKNMAMTQLFAPKLKELQTKYRNNRQKLAEETAKLQREGYNPMGGCLPMVLTLVILFGVLDVVYKPMTYFERFEDVEKGSIQYVKDAAKDIEFRHYLAENGLEEGSDEAKNREKTLSTQYSSLQGEIKAIGVYRNKDYTEEFEERLKEKEGVLERLKSLDEKIVFAGIDFSEVPYVGFAPIILIPVLSFLLSVVQTVLTMYIQKRTSPEAAQQMGGMKVMFYIMPLFSLFIAFQFPAGVGFYWSVSYVLGIAQSVLIFKIWSPEKLKAEAMAALEKRNAGYKAGSVVVIEKDDGEKRSKRMSDMSSSERKEYYRKKLEEARKADLEKYGEVGAGSPDGETEQPDDGY
ncbi:MAG: YidC/Oxa1 family membrane protein insertase [Oscillospiraceae bacterium]|jgi:YidC/Oxa1 family membrane protein insertase|nr:YidC/Oxa1 family membrane protein insertase [Oscillospiraceae bacterium]